MFSFVLVVLLPRSYNRPLRTSSAFITKQEKDIREDKASFVFVQYESKSTDPPSVTLSTHSTTPSTKDKGEIVQYPVTENSHANGRGIRCGLYSTDDDKVEVSTNESASRCSHFHSAVHDGMLRIRSSSIHLLRNIGGH